MFRYLRDQKSKKLGRFETLKTQSLYPEFPKPETLNIETPNPETPNLKYRNPEENPIQNRKPIILQK